MRDSLPGSGGGATLTDKPNDGRDRIDSLDPPLDPGDDAAAANVNNLRH